MVIEASKIADLVERVGPTVVRIEAGHRFSGSGTVWGPDGIVVTAHHVIEREEGIELGTSSGTVKASLVGSDPGTGLAVLRADAKLASASLGNTQALRVGDFVVALARPGKSVRATFGIVGALGDSFRTPMGGHVERYLEPNLDVPPGYSGGPLVNLEGEVVGINNRGVLRRHHLALPRETVDRVVLEIVSHGKVRRGYLGVGVHPVKLPEAIVKLAGQEVGVLVHGIEPGSNAEKAGILQGDVILSLDGHPIGSPWELASVLGGRVATEVALQVARAGAIISVKSQT